MASRSILIPAVLAMLAPTGAGAVAPGVVEHTDTVTLGQATDTYSWLDSKGLLRTVSLKKQGAGNGGYAIQMTYQYLDNGAVRTVTANAPNGGDGGFGYFVSHERYRDFSDGTQNTIAGKIFHADDSPLGRGFAASIQRPQQSRPGLAIYRATIQYPHYGTAAAHPVNADGSDVPALPVDPASYALYKLPVTVSWYFEAGKDYPRIRTRVSMVKLVADLVSFDLRGPYGVLDFDNGIGRTVTKVMWGDRFHFRTVSWPVTRNSTWVWSQPNKGARYNALIAGGYEMGFYQPIRYAKSTMRDGYADERGLTSSTFRQGKGCAYQAQIIPCDWEWAYQSVQYSLPYDSRTTPTTFKKMAWGSTAYWGTGPSLGTIWDSPTTSSPFVGFPQSKVISYDVCLVLGRTVNGGLTKAAASLTKGLCAAVN